jgi:hypothetical protein
MWVPEHVSEQPPRLPITGQDLSTKYYYSSTIDYFINLINSTLSALCIQQGLSSNAIFFTLNESTQLLEMNILNNINYGINILLYVNEPLYNLLSGFQSQEVINSNITFKKPRLLNQSNSSAYNKRTLTDNTVFSVSTCEIPINPTWNPIASIVFSSTLLPLITTNISPEELYGGNLLSLANESANFKPVLTDFEVPITQLNTYRNGIFYQPTGPYRLNDLTGSTPINYIDIRVEWKDKYGNHHPFYLTSGGNCEVKMLFVRKDFNNINLNI